MTAFLKNGWMFSLSAILFSITSVAAYVYFVLAHKVWIFKNAIPVPNDIISETDRIDFIDFLMPFLLHLNPYTTYKFFCFLLAGLCLVLFFKGKQIWASSTLTFCVLAFLVFTLGVHYDLSGIENYQNAINEAQSITEQENRIDY